MFSPEELKRILQESDVIKNVSIIKEAKLFDVFVAAPNFAVLSLNFTA